MTWPVIDYGDTWGLGVGASDSCSIKMYPDSDPIFIYGFDGYERYPKTRLSLWTLNYYQMPEIDAATYTYRAYRS